VTGWRYGARSDVGLVRDGNEDAAYAGPRLLVVADGVGGSVAGEIASNIAIAALAPLDRDDSISDPLAALRDATRHANDEMRTAIEADPSLAGMGTTLTAMLWAGDSLGLAQLGDSRAYLLRDGELSQVTRDQTLVQSLVDEGQITPEEALTHPRRSWILRALDGRSESDPEVEVLTTRPGDRYLLCSDGLSDYVDAADIAEALAGDDPQDACDRLVDLALRAGAPDNVTCVVADPVDEPQPQQPPLLSGAAGASPRIPTDPAPSADASAAPATRGRHAVEGGSRTRSIARPLILVATLIVVLVAAAIIGTVVYIHHQWYVASSGGKVAIFQGVHGKAAGIKLSHVHRVTDIPATALPQDDRDRLANSIGASGLSSAQGVVSSLREDACPTPSPTPVTTPSSHHRHHLRKPQPTPSPTPAWCTGVNPATTATP
jgi:protein phosphatase